MKKVGSWIWGIVLIVLGVIWGLNALDLANINIFFPGWWTLFIIIPCFVSLITEPHKTASLIGLLVGVCLLLGCWDVIGFDVIWKLALPVVLVIIGCSLVFRNGKKGETVERIRVIEVGKDGKAEEYWATFGEQNLDYDGKEFTGCEVEAVFGGVNLDLRGAKIEDDVVVKASSIFGGVKIWVPEGVKVEVVSTSIFGGVSDKRLKKKEEKDEGDDARKTLYIDATCVFGGVEIV